MIKNEYYKLFREHSDKYRQVNLRKRNNYYLKLARERGKETEIIYLI